MMSNYYCCLCVFFAISLMIGEFNEASADNIPFTYCSTRQQVFNVTYLYITDNADGSDACINGECKFFGGHIYTVKGEGCGGHNGELITSLRFAVIASSDIKVLGTPVVSNYPVLNGDLCSFMINSNPTNIQGHEVLSCPAHAPACTTIQYTYQAPVISIPLPYSEFLSFGFKTEGRVWINSPSSGGNGADADADAAMCIGLNVLYIPTTPLTLI